MTPFLLHLYLTLQEVLKVEKCSRIQLGHLLGCFAGVEFGKAPKHFGVTPSAAVDQVTGHAHFQAVT